MASKDLYEICEKPFYGKQTLIPFGECDSRFHSNCLQTYVSQTNVSASTDKSAYNCDSYFKLTAVRATPHFTAKSNQKEALSTESECTASRTAIMNLSACS
jgi:hypothetical protein